MVYNLLIGPGFNFGCFTLFLVFQSHFAVTALELDLLSGTYLYKLLFLRCPVLKNNSL